MHPYRYRKAKKRNSYTIMMQAQNVFGEVKSYVIVPANSGVAYLAIVKLLTVNPDSSCLTEECGNTVLKSTLNSIIVPVVKSSVLIATPISEISKKCVNIEVAGSQYVCHSKLY